MKKGEVYSWRVSAEVLAGLERKAREAGVSVAALLDRLASEWIESATDRDDEETQRGLQNAAMRAIGRLSGGDPDRSRRVRSDLRAKLRARRAG